MEKKALTLEEIHNETVGLLKKLIEICDLLEINYVKIRLQRWYSKNKLKNAF